MPESRWLRKPEQVPDAVIVRGPVGVGKSAAAWVLHELLKQAHVPHAALDLDWLSAGWPEHGPGNNEQRTRNVSAVAASYRAAGARYFILAGVVESADDVASLRDALGANTLCVCRLTASPAAINERLRRRESDESLAWHLDRALELAAQFASDGLDDLVVDADGSAREVAEDLGRLLGWLRS